MTRPATDRPIVPAGYHDLVASLPFLGTLTSTHDHVVAGAYEEILITYEVGASGLADGAWIKLTFRFYSDWGLFQTEDPKAANYISAELQPRPLLPGETTAPAPHLKLRFDQKGHERPFQKAVIIDLVDGYLRPGDKILIRLGDRRGGSPGTRVQSFIDDDFRFRAYIDPVGTSRFAPIPGDIVLKISPGAPAALRVITPRLVRAGEAFPITVRAEDAWGNCCQPTGIAFELHGAGSIPLELYPDTPRWAAAQTRLTLDKPGTANLTAKLIGTDLQSAPAPVTVDADLPWPRIFYADLHVHSSNTVGTNSTEYNLAYGRDVAGLDVFGYTANDFNITTQRWEQDVALCRSFAAPSRFITFAGTEWNGNSAAGGDRNVIFLGEPVFPAIDGKPLRSFEWNEDMGSATLTAGAWPVDKLHSAYESRAGDILMIPHVGGRRCNLDWHEPRLEHLVEIASAWGHFPWFYQDAIERGYRVGASAAGDEHRGRPGGGAPGVDVFGTAGGLTGVLADELTTASVAGALLARRTFATTGPRLAGLLTNGAAVQGDVIRRADMGEFAYRLLGSTGWEWVAAFSDGGILWERNLHAELGFSSTKLRIRWGGARIRDRYRWARWSGTVTFNVPIQVAQLFGLEHNEERIVQTDGNTVAIQTETYGDADGFTIEVPRIAGLTLSVDFAIQSYAKTGSPLARNPNPACPAVRWDVNGDDLLRVPAIRRELPGAELFLAVERVTDAPLPVELAGRFTLPPADQGASAVYITARQTDDDKIWTSPIFIENNS